ncbi:MAG: hypothetical protein JWN73_190 [Betaproteobacteria bacterium]|nr:hypothetical protein [Betaproteobacteria bacterium]
MPALSVAVDGELLATVNTDDSELLHIHVSKTVTNDETATLRVVGGFFPEGGQHSLLHWIHNRPVQPGQIIEISFPATGTTSHRGKTVKELYPEGLPAPRSDFQLTPEFFADIRSRCPTLSEKHSFRFVAVNGAVFEHETTLDDIGFLFALRWSAVYPEHAPVELHSYTIDHLESSAPVNCHFEQGICIGQTVRFSYSLDPRSAI